MGAITLKMLESLTAAEAFELVIGESLRRGQDEGGLPEGGACFECYVLEKCFKALTFKPGIEKASDLKEFQKSVLHCVRSIFVKGAGTTEMASAAGTVSSLIAGVCEPVGLEALTMLAVQITAALHGLMKKHIQYERCLFVLEGMDCCEPLERESLERLLLCLENCEDPDVEVLRASDAYSLRGLRFVRWYRDEFLVSGRTVPELPESEDIFEPECLAARMNADPHALPEFVGLIVRAPLSWLLRFYGKLEGIARQAVGMALERVMGIAHGADMQRAIESARRDQAAFMDWLRNGNAQAHAGHRFVEVLLDALRRREHEDSEWHAGMLRYGWEDLTEDGLWRLPQGLVLFWRMEAFRACGHAERAVALCSEAMSRGLENPVLWWLLAECHLDLKQFGQAEHALGQAGQRAQGKGMWAVLDESRWMEMLSGCCHRLGRLALDTAKNSKVLESALLELAMTYGDDAVVAEAALCAFDGDVCDMSVICGRLAERKEARKRWLETLVLRHDDERADALYELSRYLEMQDACAGEALLLESASRMADPYSAAVTLRQALEKLSSDEDIYWTAVDLWIDLETQPGAFDEAVMGVADAFAVPHPRATKALMFLVARSPKEAFEMIRDLLVERIGMEATKAAFERIRQGKHREAQAEPALSCSVDDMSEMLLPMNCVMLYRAARLNVVSQEDRMRAERRECVLRARGLMGSKYEHAPEPAAWEHHQQARASDAFDG